MVKDLDRAGHPDLRLHPARAPIVSMIQTTGAKWTTSRGPGDTKTWPYDVISENEF